MNIKESIKKNYQCIIIFALLAIYYGYRLFHITPWYDETYTYINFINEGFWYSATHWPAPNNHIFFSMLSSLINWCGVYIGLRGISYLAAMGTVILLYKLFREFTSKTVSIITVLSYTLFLLTNRLAVQGRGYSLGTFFLILAVYFGYRIAFKDEVKKKDYILWAIALWLGLYTVVTSVYWVVGLCLSCGIVLLVLKKYKTLVKLIVSSLVAAGFTTISYAIMWFSIGAQRISSDITTGYYGADVWFLIKEFPRTCLMRGIEIMTTDRSVQGVDRDAFLRDFKFFARGILSEVFGITSMWFFYGLIAVVVASLILFVICVVRKKNKYIYLLAISSIGFLGMFVTLWIQSAYPFVRVFSYIGIFLIIPIGMLYAIIAEHFAKLIKWKHIGLVVCILATVFTGAKLTSDAYIREYDYVDYYALDAIEHVEWDEVGTFMVSDYYIEQQVQFQKIIGDKCELQVDTDSPDVILTKKQLSVYWPDYITNEDLERCYVQEREVLYENEIYVVYGR